MDFRTLKEREDIVTLHEVGHFIVMYALGMYDKFTSISIIPDGGKLGLTDLNETGLATYSADFAKLNQNAMNSSSDFNALSSFWFIEGPKSFLPHLCRLYAGGSICRYYGVNELGLCEIDTKYIESILKLYRMEDGETMKNLQLVIDKFLSNVFLRYEGLTQTIFAALKESKSIDKAAMDEMIKIWEDATFRK